MKDKIPYKKEVIMTIKKIGQEDREMLRAERFEQNDAKKSIWSIKRNVKKL